jgi:hypothetical protein
MQSRYFTERTPQLPSELLPRIKREVKPEDRMLFDVMSAAMSESKGDGAEAEVACLDS